MIFPDGVNEYLTKFKGEDATVVGQMRRAHKQFATLEPFLARSVLDIGCGLGCVDVLLARAGVQTIHLMDGNGEGMRRDDYGADVKAWNDVHLAAEMVTLNAPKGTMVIAHEADSSLKISPVEMIFSFKSWGTHYPVSTYLSLARRCLVPGGWLILDLRKWVDPTEDVREICAAGFTVHKRLSQRQWVFKC